MNFLRLKQMTTYIIQTFWTIYSGMLGQTWLWLWLSQKSLFAPFTNSESRSWQLLWSCTFLLLYSRALLNLRRLRCSLPFRSWWENTTLRHHFLRIGTWLSVCHIMLLHLCRLSEAACWILPSCPTTTTTTRGNTLQRWDTLSWNRG